MLKLLWNPVTAWNISSWVTIAQMAWFREVAPNAYDWVMDLAGPPVSFLWGQVVAGFEVATGLWPT